MMANEILVPVDFSDVTDAVLAEAARLGKAFGAKLWLIHVAVTEPDFVGYEIGPVYVRDSAAQQLRHEHQKLQEFQQGLQDDGLDVTAMLVPGEPAEKILDEIRRLEPERVVLGSHGHGALHHLLAGSVCEYILKHAPCPVVVVPCRGGDEKK